MSLRLLYLGVRDVACGVNMQAQWPDRGGKCGQIVVRVVLIDADVKPDS